MVGILLCVGVIAVLGFLSVREIYLASRPSEVLNIDKSQASRPDWPID
jgi:hypothetical protein